MNYFSFTKKFCIFATERNGKGKTIIKTIILS